ncbi:MAG: hepatic lectin [Planctomycetaceae bacterium]|nr:hepatic lectin [Planctomycetaceae bacterium]
MSRWNVLVAVALCCSVSVAADQLAEKWQKRVVTLEESYAAAATRADNAKFFALQKANNDRIKGLRAAMSDATKLGDFEAATLLKEQATKAEKEGVGRAKPKNIIKFAGHEYAIIEDKVTWHVAKRRCEEMGGHLAMLKTPDQVAFGFDLYKKFGDLIWLGATDEELEGDWKWVDGSRVEKLMFTDRKGDSNHLIFNDGRLLDGNAGARCAFLCEWDK